MCKSKCDGVLVLKWSDEESLTYICQGNCQQSLPQELRWNNWPYWKHGILISLCIFHTSNLGSGKERAQLQGNKKTPYNSQQRNFIDYLRGVLFACKNDDQYLHLETSRVTTVYCVRKLRLHNISGKCWRPSGIRL